jgi:hypothetical protein
MRKIAGYTWTDYKTYIGTAKKLNITAVLDKIQEQKRNCLQHINKMPHNRLPRILQKLQTNMQKKPRETIKETSRHAKPEQVNQWPNSMFAR